LQTDINFANGVKVILGTSLQEVFSMEDGTKTQQILTEKFNANLNVSYKIRPWNLLIDYTGNLYGPMRLPTFDDPADTREKYSPYWGNHNIQFTYDGFDRLEIYGGVKNLLNWTPAKDNDFVISRGNDPFEKDPNETLRFDTTYVYTSLQGIRGFLGLRYELF